MIRQPLVRRTTLRTLTQFYNYTKTIFFLSRGGPLDSGWPGASPPVPSLIRPWSRANTVVKVRFGFAWLPQTPWLDYTGTHDVLTPQKHLEYATDLQIEICRFESREINIIIIFVRSVKPISWAINIIIIVRLVIYIGKQ